MTVGLAVPQTGEGALDPTGLDALLAAAEAAEVDSLWVTEQLFGPTPRLEPLALLAYAAARTERVRLGTAVLLAGAHAPVHLARALATVDHLSGGRLDVGLGLGGDPTVNRATGTPDRGRGAHLDAVVTTLLDLWAGGPVTSRQGAAWEIVDRVVAPGPLQRPHPPLLFGGTSDGALDRAAHLGDGWVGSGNTTPADFARTAADVRRRVAEQPGDRPFQVVKRQYLAVDGLGGTSREQVRAWYRAVYPGRDDSHLADIVTIGPPAACAEAVAALAAAGADGVILSPVPAGAGPHRALLDDVLPAVRALLPRSVDR